MHRRASKRRVILTLVGLGAACNTSPSGLLVGTDDAGLSSGGGVGGAGPASGDGGDGSGGTTPTRPPMSVGDASAPVGSGGASGSGGTSGTGGTMVPRDGASPGAGGSSGGVDAPRDAAIVPPGSACVHIESMCARLEGCLGLLAQIYFGDRATCTERLLLACRDEAAAKGTALTAASSLACARALDGASCADLMANRIDACVIKGTIGDGMICGGNTQCSSGLCRGKVDGCGVCAIKSGAGGLCRKDKNEDCQSGFVCADGVCATPGNEGVACSKRQPCAYGLFCAKAGVCAKLVAQPGAPCEKDGCDYTKSLVCNDQAKVCQTFRVGKPGDACGFLLNPPTLCPFGDPEKTCRPSLLMGVCVAPAREGELCGELAGGRECLAPAYCDKGVCRLGSIAGCVR